MGALLLLLLVVFDVDGPLLRDSEAWLNQQDVVAKVFQLLEWVYWKRY